MTHILSLSAKPRLVPIFATLLALLPALALGAASAAAQQSIAFVDVDKIVKEAKAWKKFTSQIEKDSKKLQTRAQDYQDRLKKENQSLLQGKDSLSPSDLRKKQHKLQTRKREYEEELSKTKAVLDKRFAAAQTKLGEAIERAAANVARENDVSIIVNRALLVYATDNLNLTDKVAKRLNKQLKKIPSS